VYFCQPDALKGSLTVTMREVRPTLFFSVPRVWEKIQEKMAEMGRKTTGIKKVIQDKEDLFYCYCILPITVDNLSYKEAYSIFEASSLASSSPVYLFYPHPHPLSHFLSYFFSIFILTLSLSSSSPLPILLRFLLSFPFHHTPHPHPQMLVTWAKGLASEHSRLNQFGNAGGAPLGFGCAHSIILSKIKETLGLDQVSDLT
jgi:hypothetical protein